MIRIRKMVCAASAAVMMGMASAGNAAPLELALVLDASGSITGPNWTLQTTGYQNAIQNVVPVNGTVSISVVRFASTASVVRPMTLINSAADLLALSTFFSTLPQTGGSTCISCAIVQAHSTFSATPGVRRVIDVSTDGVFNVGGDPNGAANVVGSSRWAVDGDGLGAGGAADTVNVIGIGVAAAPNFDYGLNSFNLLAPDFASFQGLLQSKLEREITGVIPVPGALPLLVSGLFAFGWLARRRVGA